MKRIASLIYLILVCNIAFSQKDYFDIEYIEENSYKFPILIDEGKSQVQKINQILQLSELYLLKGYGEKSIFKNFNGTGVGIYGNKLEIEPMIQSNNKKILSIQFREASCGATCAYWVNYYNFNSGNGDLIELEDIFTLNGYKLFKKYANKKRKEEFDLELLRLEIEPIGDFQNIPTYYENDNLDDYFIKGDSIFIDGENCFHKNLKFYGIETICKFHLSEFNEYLNEYGQVIFSKTKKGIELYKSKKSPQLYKGKIGNRDILMLLNNAIDGEIEGEYVYLKYGQGIYLKGTLDEEKLILKERIEYEINGYIEGDLNGNKIEGFWYNKNKSKNYKLELFKI